jgi:hypothetical protein
VGGGLLVRDLGGVSEYGVDEHGHGQFVEVSVIEHAAAGRNIKCALLLLLGAFEILLVTHDLEPEEAGDDNACPKQKEKTDEPEARPRKGDDAGRIFAGATGSDGCRHKKT